MRLQGLQQLIKLTKAANIPAGSGCHSSRHHPHCPGTPKVNYTDWPERSTYPPAFTSLELEL